MFTARLGHMCISTRMIIRNLRTRKKFGANPGVDNRIKEFRRDGFKVDHGEAEEYIEQSESDFYKVGEAYNEHLNETLIGKYEERHQIVKEKYFKHNMPNLLTWSEKEQIRHLAATEPDEWTPEKLATSFPVTVPVVKKLLKYVWKPASEDRITRHDQSVMRNWKELKEGTLSIPEDIREHFLKFSERTIPPLDHKSIKKIDITPDEKIGEYERIIRSCASKENDTQNNSKDNSNLQITDNKPKRKEKVATDSKVVTLDELAEKIQARLKAHENVNIPDQIMINTINTSQSKPKPDYNNIDIELSENNKKNSIVEFKEKVDTKDIMAYPERIRIPKKAYKRNATYKINDCYYDHDGRFLYRVLGMTKAL